MLKMMVKKPDSFRVIKYDGSFESIQHIRSITNVNWNTVEGTDEPELPLSYGTIKVLDPMSGYCEVEEGMNLVFAATHAMNFAILSDEELALRFAEESVVEEQTTE